MLFHKVRQVRMLLNEASGHTEKFCKISRLACNKGCFSCCLKKDLFVSPLEFLPLAWNLYEKGKAEEVFDKTGKMKSGSSCYFFSPFGESGGCTVYKDRGLLCRLFGFSSDEDKNGNHRLVCCKGIKKTLAYRDMSPSILNESPEYSDFYLRLGTIDFPLATEQLQINEAIHKALGIVLNYEFLLHYKVPG